MSVATLVQLLTVSEMPCVFARLFPEVAASFLCRQYKAYINGWTAAGRASALAIDIWTAHDGDDLPPFDESPDLLDKKEASAPGDEGFEG